MAAINVATAVVGALAVPPQACPLSASHPDRVYPAVGW